MRSTTLGLALLGLIASGALADDLKVGDKAPDFTLVGSDGKTYSLSDFKGKSAVVVAWFPKAMTKGCTAECKSFKAASSELKPLKVAYFTASVDKPELNKQFSDSLSLDYPILSDPTKATAKAYGVLNEREMANRWTFYIDKEGVIKGIEKKVNTAAAGPELVAKIKELKLEGE